MWFYVTKEGAYFRKRSSQLISVEQVFWPGTGWVDYPPDRAFHTGWWSSPIDEKDLPPETLARPVGVVDE
jgi:hypothetical protein